jgi:cobalt-precorrin 5A hydrolase / precorrin-3B C17-methyltransferase
MKNSSVIFNDFLPFVAVTTTPQGLKILKSFANNPQITLLLPEKLRENNSVAGEFYQDSLKNKIQEIWHQNKAFVFCLATGAVVRLISPLLTDKNEDPAIVVIDPEGKYVISLCGGHTGGADQLTCLIASYLNATPILTGASNALEIPAIDVLGLPYGWKKGTGDWNGVSGAVARGETVEIVQEAGSTLWQYHLPPKHSFYGLKNGFTDVKEENRLSQAKIWISKSKRDFSEDVTIPQVQWHPRVLWVGIGCERNTPKTLIESGLRDIFEQYGLAFEAIAGIATIDLKQDEVGILELCEEYNFPLKTFNAEELKNIDVPNPSNIVKKEVGTPSVAEACAICAVEQISQLFSESENDQKDYSLIIPKQIIKKEGEKGALTIAIAQSTIEYTANQGNLFLVGIGPGSLAQMTIAAKTAIMKADAIIGYSLYLNLINPLTRPGQIIEHSPITQEKQRAKRAIALAQWGLTVAVISSGDCGIYGMGGLVLEALKNDGWDGKNPQVQIFPGITALQAVASRVGTPLMHDFCAISLSDLLNPWETIEKRLNAAAQGDFITSLYNPRSEKRREQIVKAREIFLQFRDGNTPVAIVKSAYREDEEITLTTLEKMLDFPIDMLTMVMIGNSTTYYYENWMITPRSFPC